MAGSATEPADQTDPLTDVQQALPIEDGRGDNPRQVNSNLIRKVVFLSITIKSTDTWEDDSGVTTRRFEVSVLDTSELSSLPSCEAGATWIDSISTNVFATDCNAINSSSGSEAFAFQVARRVARMPRNAIEDGIEALRERIRASPDVKYVLVHRNTDTTHSRVIQRRISNQTPNQVSLVNLSAVFSSARSLVARYDGPSNIQNILRVLELDDSGLRTARYPTALMLKALVIMATESADAVRTTTSTTDIPSTVLPPQSQANEQGPSALNNTGRVQLYTRRDQIDVDPDINQKTAKACISTIEFVEWLVQEAGVFTDVGGVYTRDGDFIRLVSTSKFIALAQIVRNYKAAVGALQWAVDVLDTSLDLRREVTGYFLSFPCEEGSAFDDENNRHLYFNEEVLAKVLGILEQAL